MKKFTTLLLVLLFSLASVFQGCEDDEKKEEPPQVRVSLEGGEEAGTQAGEEAGQQAGEVAGGEEVAGEDLPLDQGVSDAGELVGDQDVSGGEDSPEEDCASEDLDADAEDCTEPEPVIDESELPES